MAQNPPTNYDESKAGQYQLPDPLVMQDGTAVTDAEMWRTRRRPELLSLFETQMFGKMPGRLPATRFEPLSAEAGALGGIARRKEVRALFAGGEHGPCMDILIYLPAQADGPVPLFVGLNFQGNHTVRDEPGIRLSRSWIREGANAGVVNNRSTESSRGVASRRWDVPAILGRGYGLATAYYGDIDPDYDDGFQNGVHPLFCAAGQTRPAADECATIGAWAWGLSRIMDYLETDPEVDSGRVAVMGHSRLGKTSLWAGAADERFALVISNNSGCGGAALSRRDFGETLTVIQNAFPHWFCGNFRQYAGNEESLPFDQHELIALIAPRPVYVASAAEDLWADPRGEYLAAYNAGPVYRLLGQTDLESPDMPAVDEPLVDKTVGYHLRTGKHDVTPWDWQRWMDFADRHMK